MKNFFENEENQFPTQQEASESYEDLLTQELNGYFPEISELDIAKYLEDLDETAAQQSEASSEEEPEQDIAEGSEAEESEETEENVVFTDEYYSKHKAQYIHHSFVIKARKL